MCTRWDVIECTPSTLYTVRWLMLTIVCVCVCVLLQILASTYDDDLKKKKEHSKRSESSEDVALSGGFMWNDR